eukprot:COSAG05_NODE_1083_length_5933_cov_3.284196_4_plen_64_part_00
MPHIYARGVQDKTWGREGDHRSGGEGQSLLVRRNRRVVAAVRPLDVPLTGELARLLQPLGISQ